MVKKILQTKLTAILTIILLLLFLWLFFSYQLNKAFILDRYQANNQETSQLPLKQLIWDSWYSKKPVLPSPMQVIVDMKKFIFQTKISSKKSLVYHGWITFSSTMLGFFIGSLSGVLLAVGIIYNQTLKKSLLPWVVASQTVPILAIAPMIVVVLGAIGLVGLIPKSIVSAYLAFFPVTIGMVKGLNCAEQNSRELLQTYSASQKQKFFKLLLPSSVPFLFTSLKVSVAASLVGAIVGELPTGARAGLGSRLLVGSYYGQNVKIWAALLTTALLASFLIFLVVSIEKVFIKKGFRP